MSDVFLGRLLKQRAIYWDWTTIALPDQDTEGQKIYSAPVEIKCRFELQPMEFLDKDGNKSDTNAKVFADRDLKELGLLWLGKLSDLPNIRDPFKNIGVFEIRKFDKIPSLDARKFLRTAYLYRAGTVGTAGHSERK